MSRYVALTCTEFNKDGGLCKYAIRVKAADIQVMVSTEISWQEKNAPPATPVPVTVIWLPNGQRISVGESITVVEARVNEADI